MLKDKAALKYLKACTFLRRAASVVAAVLVTTACASRAHSNAQWPAELLARAEREETVRVIVELESPPEKIRASQELVIQALEGTRYRVTRRYQAVPLLALEVSAEALRRLVQSPAVRRIQDDGVARPQETTP